MKTGMPAEARALEVIVLLRSEHPDAKVALEYSDSLQLLVATILSAQCTDKTVNKVTKVLFKKYKTAEDYANADLPVLEQVIRPTGFYRNKARNVKRCCQVLVERFESRVPRSMSEMLELPGVGRKTANVVLSNAFGVIEGVAVDTHVHRLARRLGFTNQEKAERIEEDLMRIFPKTEWSELTDLLIFHGRMVCFARKPSCEHCVVSKLCPSAFTF
jgi:endonuclease III